MSGPDQLLTWSTPVDRSLLVEDGMVVCPRHGVVDVETCLACEHLLGVEGEWHARIVCSYPFEVGARVADELAAGRRWSRLPRVIDEEAGAEEDEGDRHLEDLLPGDVRPESEPDFDDGDPWHELE
jgi:hypothetical protein